MARLKGTLMSEQAGPRIGIVGAGAIGGFYGLLLARAGFDVHFLLRSDYPVVREQGWHLESCSLGTLCQPVKVYEDAAAMPRCDWLLLACKTTSNAELAPLLCAHVAQGGHLVLAGILERQAEELQQAYAPWLRLEVADREDGWILMTAVR